MTALSELWRAYGEGRVDRALELIDPDCEITPLGGRRTYAGHDGVRRLLVDIREQWKTLMVSYDAAEEHHEGCVVAAGRVEASSGDSSRTMTGQLICVAEFHSGKLRRGRAFADRATALRWAETLRADNGR
jgi:SnoaL-like domain